MAYNPIHTRLCPIDEAFDDPIMRRKIANGEMVFQKYDPHKYTQPQHFPNYLNQYSPSHPPPPKCNQSYDNYPRSNLKCVDFNCQPRRNDGIINFTCDKKYI